MKNELSGRSSPADHQAMIKKILERMHTEVDSIEESIFGRMEKISNRLNTLDSSKWSCLFIQCDPLSLLCLMCSIQVLIVYSIRLVYEMLMVANSPFRVRLRVPLCDDASWYTDICCFGNLCLQSRSSYSNEERKVCLMNSTEKSTINRIVHVASFFNVSTTHFLKRVLSLLVWFYTIWPRRLKLECGAYIVL